YGSAEDWSGFEKSPPLLAEIKRLNADFKKLDPWLASALPISQETAGSARKGLRVSALWSGETDRGQDHPGKGDALVVVARNLDYATDRDENDFGRKSRFKAKPKEKVQISLHKPEWLNPTKAVDALTGQAVSCRVENQSIRLDLETVELGKIVVIQ
ncbi:MAG: hypothetical protein HY360_02355, partial [Verrucomicrobia bacterium]|nr:hypothetical protein [Verrucomicrobiota bacterium]